MPTRYGKGMLAGLAAALVYAIVQMINVGAGWAPQFNPADLTARLLNGTVPDVVGWLLHFLLYGVVLGALFALVGPKLKRVGYTLRGVLFALVTWVVVAFVVMPASGSGIFGLRLGFAMVPLLLVSHILYGAVAGPAVRAPHAPRHGVDPAGVDD
jgi:hypothetical protein